MGGQSRPGPRARRSRPSFGLVAGRRTEAETGYASRHVRQNFMLPTAHPWPPCADGPRGIHADAVSDGRDCSADRDGPLNRCRLRCVSVLKFSSNDRRPANTNCSPSAVYDLMGRRLS